MRLLDGLSAGLTAATKAATGAQAGEREGSALLRAIQMQQIQMAKADADMQKIRADTAHTIHTDRAPVLGESGYNEAKGGEAGAIADAQVPAHVRTAVESARGTEPIKTAGAIATAQGVAPIHTREAIATAEGTEPIKTRGAINTANGVVDAHVREAGGKAAAEMPYKIQEKSAEQGFKQPTHDEMYTAFHLPIIAQGVKAIENATAPGAWQKLAQKGMLGNYTLTPAGQQYNAAVHRAALSAAVLAEGPRGAVPQRVAYFEKTYFPQPGDDPATVTDKVTQLRELVRSGVAKAGNGYQKMAPQHRQAIESFLNGNGASAGPDTQTIDAMIRAGKSDAEIQAALSRGVH